MSEKKDAWKAFQKTGSIEDYMAFKSARETSSAQKKADKDMGKRI